MHGCWSWTQPMLQNWTVLLAAGRREQASDWDCFGHRKKYDEQGGVHTLPCEVQLTSHPLQPSQVSNYHHRSQPSSVSSASFATATTDPVWSLSFQLSSSPPHLLSLSCQLHYSRRHSIKLKGNYVSCSYITVENTLQRRGQWLKECLKQLFHTNILPGYDWN